MPSRTTTVLVTDLVASTALYVEHGPAFDRARRAHDALLRSVVEAHGGRVIKGLGDGVMATFESAEAGVDAARAAQQAIHRHNRNTAGVVLSMRTGLAVGDITFEDGDCYGEAVVEASRLCALAQGEQILATTTVRAVGGRQRASGFEPCGAMELKGLPDTVAVVEVRWERVSRSAIPLPPRLATHGDTFVGRAAALDELHRAFDVARSRREPRVVLVTGEPGLGKTTLVGRAATTWHDVGATVALGRCEAHVQPPYRPFVELFEPLVEAAPREVLDAHLDRHDVTILRLAPTLARRLPRASERAATDPDSERFLVFSAVADLLAAMSEIAPLVVVLEDLHWADAGTLSLLRSLASGMGSARVLIVGTLRIDEVGGGHPLGDALAELGRLPNVDRLALDGLRFEDVLELVRAKLDGAPRDASERFARGLLAETDGNAYFVTEVIRDLVDAGGLDDAARGARAGEPLVPESLREVLGQRVAVLGTTAGAILSAAAVVGSEFDLPIVTAATGADDQAVLDVLDRRGTVCPGSRGRRRARALPLHPCARTACDPRQPRPDAGGAPAPTRRRSPRSLRIGRPVGRRAGPPLAARVLWERRPRARLGATCR
jgi:class 3 adenylate cyclase